MGSEQSHELHRNASDAAAKIEVCWYSRAYYCVSVEPNTASILMLRNFPPLHACSYNMKLFVVVIQSFHYSHVTPTKCFITTQHYLRKTLLRPLPSLSSVVCTVKMLKHYQVNVLKYV